MAQDEHERKNLSMPPAWWDAFQRAADAAGKTLSEWVGDACSAKLPAAERKRLPTRTSRGRKKGKP